MSVNHSLSQINSLSQWTLFAPIHCSSYVAMHRFPRLEANINHGPQFESTCQSTKPAGMGESIEAAKEAARNTGFQQGPESYARPLASLRADQVQQVSDSNLELQNLDWHELRQRRTSRGDPRKSNAIRVKSCGMAALSTLGGRSWLTRLPVSGPAPSRRAVVPTARVASCMKLSCL